MDERKKAPDREEKPKSTKTNIHISSEYHQEKARYPRIRRKRKCPATQDPPDRLGIFQHQIMLNKRVIQMRSESSRDSKVTSRKHQTSLACNMTVPLKANKSRETRRRRPRSPSISSGDARNCFVFQVKSTYVYRGPRVFDNLHFDTTKLHS
jgi:hypothetical protein